MNTAIKILEEMIDKLYENKEECNSCYDNWLKLCEFHWWQEWALENAIDEISSLPSLDIDSLQRYTNTTDDWMEVSPNWYWVAFKDVYDLLGR